MEASDAVAPLGDEVGAVGRAGGITTMARHSLRVPWESTAATWIISGCVSAGHAIVTRVVCTVATW